jgi:choice-of-anchor C domain-containing protein
MRSRRWPVTTLLAALLMLGTAAGPAFADGPNIVADGDFETPPSGDQTTYVKDDTFGPWTVAFGDVQQIGGFWDPASGMQSMDLNGDHYGGIFQDLATTPGATYRLTYFMAGNPDEQGLKQMNVLWDGAAVDQPTFDSTGHTRYGNMGWVMHTDTVEATKPLTRLEFASVAPATPYGPALDDVQVVLTQEPPPPDSTPIEGQARGRVIEALAGSGTVNPWVATFTDKAAADPASYRAHIAWGDGEFSDGSVIAAGDPRDCDYLGRPHVGGCFVVAATHPYARAGTHPFAVRIDKAGGRLDAQGVAEIVPPGSARSLHDKIAAVARTIGPLTFTTNGSIYGCTGEALAGTSIVLTAKHCAVNLNTNRNNDHFQFAPEERGDCWKGGNRSLAACAGSVSEPHGYWCATSSDVYRDPSAEQAPAFIVMSPCGGGADRSLPAAVGGLPVTFNPFRGLRWTAAGYPVYDSGNWRLQACGEVSDQSGPRTETTDRRGPLYGRCKLGSGVSGGPWVNLSVLPDTPGIGAVNEEVVPDGDHTIQTGSYLGDTAMLEYIQAVLATQSSYPVVSAASATNSRFAVRRKRTPRVARVHRGTVFAYRLDSAARITIVIERRVRLHGRRCAPRRTCRRTRVAMTMIRHGRKGLNRTPFTGRVGSHTLRPGRYRAVIEARDAAGHRTLAPPRVAFTVVRA